MIGKNEKRIYIKAAMCERIVLYGSIIYAFFVLVLGYYFAYKTADPHCMNRAGSAIVAVEGMIAILEYKRQGRLDRIRHSASIIDNVRDSGILEREIRKAEFQIVFIAAIIAVIGEVFHGFGDIFFMAFAGISKH